MKIIVVRHGETQWNALGKLQGREDVPLSSQGRRQAEEAGKALALYPFSGRGPVIVASPLQRAAETGRWIQAALPAADFITDEVLLERDYGAAAGLTLQERQLRYPDEAYPGLEDLDQARKRIVQGIERLAGRFADRDLILVSHGEISHIFLAWIRGEKTQTGRSALKNASISSVLYEPGTGFTIEYYNLAAEELLRLLQKEGRE